MAFSTFGAWDKAVQQFLTLLSEKTPLLHQDMQEWFYNQGVLIFRNSHAGIYYPDIKHYTETFHHRPIITTSWMLGMKYLGFMELRNQFIAKFVANTDLEGPVFDYFNSFVTNALDDSVKFIKLESEITTKVNQLQDEFPQTSPEKIIDYVLNLFLEAYTTYPDLTDKIKLQITLLEEYVAQNNPVATNKVATSQLGVFSSAKQSAETVAEEMISSQVTSP